MSSASHFSKIFSKISKKLAKKFLFFLDSSRSFKIRFSDFDGFSRISAEIRKSFLQSLSMFSRNFITLTPFRTANSASGTPASQHLTEVLVNVGAGWPISLPGQGKAHIFWLLNRDDICDFFCRRRTETTSTPWTVTICFERSFLVCVFGQNQDGDRGYKKESCGKPISISPILLECCPVGKLVPMQDFFRH